MNQQTQIQFPKYKPLTWVYFIDTANDNTATIAQVNNEYQAKDGEWHYFVDTTRPADTVRVDLKESDILLVIEAGEWRDVRKQPNIEDVL